MPEPLHERARTSLRLRALDLRDRVGRRSDRLVPPRRLDFVGHSDFVDTGDEFLRHFRELGALARDERVLDVGCGIGRMARPLAGYLSPKGSYDGFDVNPEGIAWCRDRYAGRPNFRFELVDLFNRRYNPAGTLSAETFAFPYADACFDLVIATSVMTHLLESETDRYLGEIGRVLAPGGRLLATWFLLDDLSRRAIADGRAGLPFLDPEQRVAVVSDDLPEEAVAYDRGWVMEAFRRHGLELASIHPGTWRGDDDGCSFQDIVVGTKT
ncbi:class I SAM-dependent methyltransferase [Baekduia soli]|uniref:class I SAM-dependent methyltransferase n=1 Tax=Baekduia soli TaxID=496014 RepID=UPI001652602B|nr:class I SAM-dependent methyltransferase [Baekduia soli]